MTRTVLIISYFFPPVGGAGVQRVTKFVKYLPQIGWQPVVLTASNPSVPVFDETLLDDVPSGTEVYRARTLEPGYAMKQAVSASAETSGSGLQLKSAFKGLLRRIASVLLQPDPQILWFPAAVKQAHEAIRKHKPAVIFVSAPPFSSLLIGAWMARRYGLPLILDYRDEWDISNSVWENKKFSGFSRAIQSRMQSYAIRSCAAIVATTMMSVRQLQSKAQTLGVNATAHCIYNGFDADDFSQDRQTNVAAEKYVLSYVGTLWNLTSIEPLVAALKRLAEEAPEILERIELRIAGRRTAEQEEILASLQGTALELKLYDYMDHATAIRTMQDSNGLLLLLGEYEFAGRVVPGKLFEYFATANAIFAIAPKGEVWDLLQDYPLAFKAHPADVDTIVEQLRVSVSNFINEGRARAITFDANPYERMALTKQLAEVFSTVGKS